jgi:exodeoxyribonuclease-3
VLILSYNVNSLSARLPRLLALLDHQRPDIALLQETKATPQAFPHLPLQGAGYAAIDHSGGGREGVAILARRELQVGDVEVGLPGEPDPHQARWVEATVNGLRVASVYVPNGRVVGSDEFKRKLEFLEAMVARAALLSDLPMVMAGDMNVCPTDQDVWDVRQVHGATHVTVEERSRMQRVLDAGFVDAFRTVNPAEAGFTWWDYRAGHFHKGYGLRIDLALVSRALLTRLREAWVDRAYRKPTTVPGTKPSDHAPLLVRLDEDPADDRLIR